MENHENPEIDFTADEHDGEPAAQRAKVEEPDHLLCPITRVMFRDPVVLVESGNTYEREAIKRHLRISKIDPRSNVRIGSKQLAINRGVRDAVWAWLEENPNVTPFGWDTRDMLTEEHIRRNHARNHAKTILSKEDVDVLYRLFECHPELRHTWRGDDPGEWEGVHWSSEGRVTALCLAETGLSGSLPRLEGLTCLEDLIMDNNNLSGTIPEDYLQGLTKLKRVWLFANDLSGNISEKLFQGLSALEDVNLGINQLFGSIPENLFQDLKCLESVCLAHNRLVGEIPTSLFQGLSSLTTVHLFNNNFSGPIPDDLFKDLPALKQVLFYDDRFLGPTPQKFVDMNYKFRGDLPEGIDGHWTFDL